MRSLRFDSVGGASGDMILGTLIDLGVDVKRLNDSLASLDIGDFEIRAERVTLKGLTGTRASVILPDGHCHEHRGLKDIRDLVNASDLDPMVQVSCLNVFERLAKAEAAVHDMPVDKIHFHEVGARDAILDIAGSCLALHWLDVAAISVGPLPLGSGTVACAHGVLPLPAPATATLLEGHPVTQTDETVELVTPTGAALLMEWQEAMGSGPDAGSIAARGYGFGQRDLAGRANLLRAMIIELPVSGEENDTCLVLECNLDDTVPELLGSLSQRLLDAGALDVFTTPVQMKKQRPGTLLTVLCRDTDRVPLMDLVFTESTTFGIREYPATRTTLARRHVSVETPYGPVRVKVGTWKGRDITRSPEHDDCVKQSKAANVPVRTVYEAAMRAAKTV